MRAPPDSSLLGERAIAILDSPPTELELREKLFDPAYRLGLEAFSPGEPSLGKTIARIAMARSSLDGNAVDF